MADNYFKNTKASYFDDIDIVKYWVNIENITQIVLPESSIPIRILGGKGSGKTHILRYFSFQTQKIRAHNEGKTCLQYIQENKYLGIYMSINGLALNRFSGKGISEEEWNSLFFYYINLEFVERYIKKLLEIFQNTQKNIDTDKKIFIHCLFKNKHQTLESLFTLVEKEKSDIDSRISKLSMPFANKEVVMHGINPIFPIESSFLEVIYTILNEFDELNNIKVLFIIDEFENATVNQKKYYNTLLRHPDHEKVKRISIRIAGRLTIEPDLDTFDDNEKLLEGSEINTVFLEDFFRNTFADFTKRLYKKRLLSDELINLEASLQTSKECNEKELSIISSQKKVQKKFYLQTFEKALLKTYKKEEVKQILNNIQNDDIFYEKMNTFLCYKKWNSNLVLFSNQIKEMLDKNDLSLYEQQNKFKIDMTYQLFREFRKKYYISGYDEILKLSNFNPRIFLLILSNIFDEASLEKVDFFNDTISCKIQHNALLEASTWFWNNFTEDIQDSKVLWAVNEICSFFREARQSPKPSEKTMISFSYVTSEVSEEINKLVDIAVYHSLLIENRTHKRKNRNTSKLERQLRIHPMLSPKWELSLTVGGTTSFSSDDMNALFLEKHKEWKELKKIKLKRLDPPSQYHSKQNTRKKPDESKTSLFD